MLIIIKSITGCLFAFEVTKDYEVVSPITGEILELCDEPLGATHQALRLHIAENTDIKLNELI